MVGIRRIHFNVLRAIVCLIIVPVVGNFLWPKRATEFLCRNKTVFADIPMLVCIRMVRHPQHYVTVIVNPSAAFPKVVCRATPRPTCTPHLNPGTPQNPAHACRITSDAIPNVGR
jgi:hypothetical protein